MTARSASAALSTRFFPCFRVLRRSRSSCFEHRTVVIPGEPSGARRGKGIQTLLGSLPLAMRRIARPGMTLFPELLRSAGEVGEIALHLLEGKRQRDQAVAVLDPVDILDSALERRLASLERRR